jgi:hypothetical protein
VRHGKVTSPPLWLVALVMAALAPWGSRALQVLLERRLRRRTLALLAKARLHTPGGGRDET